MWKYCGVLFEIQNKTKQNKTNKQKKAKQNKKNTG